MLASSETESGRGKTRCCEVDHVRPERVGAEGVDAGADRQGGDRAADTGDSTRNLHPDAASRIRVLRDVVGDKPHRLEDVLVVKRSEVDLDLHLVSAEGASFAGRERHAVQAPRGPEFQCVGGPP